MAPEPAGPARQHRLGYLDRAKALARVEAGAVVLLPVGSLEQHGDHLPLATDALLAEEVCLRAAAIAQTDLLVAPVLGTGFSPHHIRFGATVSLPAEVFLALLRAVVTALHAWAPRVLVVNGHGGNRGPLLALALETGTPVVSYWELAAAEIAARFPVDSSIGHAGEAETSLMLAAFPELVGKPAAEYDNPPNADLLVVEMGASGVIGNARAASRSAGADFLRSVVNALVSKVDALFPNEQVVS
jgi:creatinine amidohydrolase